MSKKHEGSEKSEKPKEVAAPEGKKPAAAAQPEAKKAEAPASKAKGHNPLPGGCFAWGCKTQAVQFNFCEEHYDHFKFGLIKKTGEPVPDYEKKLGHFQAHHSKRRASKAA